MRSKIASLKERLLKIEIETDYSVVDNIYGNFIETEREGCILGEAAFINHGSNDVECEVISIRNGKVLLSPLSDIYGIKSGSYVRFSGQLPKFSLISNCSGKILDAVGNELNSAENKNKLVEVYLDKSNSKPILFKSPVSHKIKTNCVVIDSLLPLGVGQKIGVFSGSGVGKSTLIGKLVNNIQCDISIVVLVGERSREAVEFYEAYIKSSEKSLLIVSPSSDNPSMKHRAVRTALSYANYFSDLGMKVVLTIDSITRLAHALREIGLSRGELPVVNGYTPSVFSELSSIVEQCGMFANNGSITMISTILVDADNFNDPISDFMRGVLDGHYILDRKLANQGVYPSIDVLNSRSRVSENIFSKKESEYESKVRRTLSDFKELEDFINTGMYQKGSNNEIDKLIDESSELMATLYRWSVD